MTESAVPAPAPTTSSFGVVEVAAASPALPERLSRLDDLAAAYLWAKTPATRAAYRSDLDSWFAYCAAAPGVGTDGRPTLGVDPLRAGIHHAEIYVRLVQEVGDPRTGRRLSPASVNRRISAISRFYTYCVRQRAVAESPFLGIDRPRLDDQSDTAGLTIAEIRQLVATAAADAPRSEALVRLLASNGLRITEAISRDVEDLTYDAGHRVLRLVRKGNKRGATPLPPATIHALETYLDGRTTGPIFVTATGNRLDRVAAYRLLRRLARTAGIAAWARISPHSLRRGFATAALDADVPLRDVQDAMGHADPRTTRRYDRGRANHDRHAAYRVAAEMAKDT